MEQTLTVATVMVWDFNQTIVLDHKDTIMEAVVNITKATTMVLRADLCQVIQMIPGKIRIQPTADLSVVGKEDLTTS